MTSPLDASYETLSVARDGADVLIVRLNRPDVANALNTAMGRELFALFEALSLEPGGVRCVVLTGAGERAFSAGGDFKERHGMSDAAWHAQHLVFERMIRALLDCPLPVIGAINGHAYGGGCELAACCDFLYAADHARFALPEVTRGIIPGGGGTQTVARAIGERRAKELILTGRPISAADAMAYGLVNALLPAAELMPTVLATAHVIAENAPIAVRQAKLAVHRGLQMSLRDGLAFEIEAYRGVVPTADRREGVAAFVEKRKPVFEGK